MPPNFVAPEMFIENFSLFFAICRNVIIRSKGRYGVLSAATIEDKVVLAEQMTASPARSFVVKAQSWKTEMPEMTRKER